MTVRQRGTEAGEERDKLHISPVTHTRGLMIQREREAERESPVKDGPETYACGCMLMALSTGTTTCSPWLRTACSRCSWPVRVRPYLTTWVRRPWRPSLPIRYAGQSARDQTRTPCGPQPKVPVCAHAGVLVIHSRKQLMNIPSAYCAAGYVSPNLPKLPMQTPTQLFI